MDCKELRREIEALGDRIRDCKNFYEEAEKRGQGRLKLENAQQKFELLTDEVLERHLLDFQEQFGNKACIEGKIKGLGDRIVSTSWGDAFAVLNDSPSSEGLYSVIEDENGEFSRGELIVSGNYNLGTFSMSNERLLLPTRGGVINVIRKKDDGYILSDSIYTIKTGVIKKVVALSKNEWILDADEGMYVLGEDTNGKLVLGEKIDPGEAGLSIFDPDCILPLSNDEVIIGQDDSCEYGLFAKDNSGKLVFVESIIEDFDDHIGEIVPIDENKWIVCNRYGSEGYFLSRSDGAMQSYEMSEPFSEMFDMNISHISHLLRNEFLLEDDDGDIFIYTVQPDGNFEKSGKVVDGGGEQDEGFRIFRNITLSDDLWLVSKRPPFSSDSSRWEEGHLYESGRNYVLRRQKDGGYELEKIVGGPDYAAKRAVPLSSRRYLFSVTSDRFLDIRNEVEPGMEGLFILRPPLNFDNVDDLKEKLDLVIEVGAQ